MEGGAVRCAAVERELLLGRRTLRHCFAGRFRFLKKRMKKNKKKRQKS